MCREGKGRAGGYTGAIVETEKDGFRKGKGGSREKGAEVKALVWGAKWVNRKGSRTLFQECCGRSNILRKGGGRRRGG